MTNTLEIQQFPLWNKLKDKRVPLGFELEVTARCNNDCRHCYINLPAGDRAAQARELTLAEIARIADQAIELGALWCLITGGEPLLRDDFADVYLMLKRKGLLVTVFTNATTLRAEHIALFKKYPPRDIEVTIYGVTRETYEAVSRRPGTYAAFVRGLDMLFDAGVRVRLKAMALRSNVHELPEIARFCRKRTKDYFRFDPLLHLRFDGNAARNEEIRSERLTPEEIVALERADQERFQSLEKNCDKLIMPELAHIGCDHLFHCGAGNRSFTVSNDGLFRLCISLWDPECVYDLRKGSLADAWQNFVPKVRDMRSNRKTLLETCHACPIINICLWCPANAHLETGDRDGAVPYFCDVAHARAKALQEAQQQAAAE